MSETDKQSVLDRIRHWLRCRFDFSYRFEVEYDALEARRYAAAKPARDEARRKELEKYSPGKRAMLERVAKGGEHGLCHLARRYGRLIRVYPGDPEYDPSRGKPLPESREWCG